MQREEIRRAPVEQVLFWVSLRQIPLLMVSVCFFAISTASVHAQNGVNAVLVPIKVNDFARSHLARLAPDGKFAYYVGFDTVLRVWDVEKNKEVTSIDFKDDKTKTGGRLRNVSVERAGNRAIVAISNGQYHLLDLPSGKKTTIKGHTAQGSKGLISPDGRFAILSGGDRSLLADEVKPTLKYWDLEKKRLTTTFIGHESFVYDMALSPDGKTLVTVGGHVSDRPIDCAVRVWDVTTKKETKKLSGHTATISCVALTRDSSKIVTGSHDRTVRLWDVKRNSEVLKIDTGGSVWSLALSLDEKVCLVACKNILSAFSLETGQQLTEFREHRGIITSVGVFPDGRTAFSTCAADDTFQIWTIPQVK